MLQCFGQNRFLNHCNNSKGCTPWKNFVILSVHKLKWTSGLVRRRQGGAGCPVPLLWRAGPCGKKLCPIVCNAAGDGPLLTWLKLAFPLLITKPRWHYFHYLFRRSLVLGPDYLDFSCPSFAQSLAGDGPLLTWLKLAFPLLITKPRWHYFDDLFRRSLELGPDNLDFSCPSFAQSLAGDGPLLTWLKLAFPLLITKSSPAS